MSDLQMKIGDGITKLQGSLQQGKQKLQTVQEISQLKKTGTEASAKRLELIVDLGEKVYELIRRGAVELPNLTQTVETIQQQDAIVYQVNKTVSEMNSKNEDSHTCECGTSVNSNVKFCGSCGKKVVIPESVNYDTYTHQCLTCGEMNPNGSSFCGCCGSKI